MRNRYSILVVMASHDQVVGDMLADLVWNVATLAIVLGCAIPLTAIIGGLWYHIEKVKSNNALKRRMIEQGLSVEEIERVMAAGKDKDD